MPMYFDPSHPTTFPAAHSFQNLGGFLLAGWVDSQCDVSINEPCGFYLCLLHIQEVFFFSDDLASQEALHGCGQVLLILLV